MPVPPANPAAKNPAAKTSTAKTSAATTRATLAVLSMAQFLIALDYSIIYIALPSVAADLHL
ncbi:MAG: hypothetical protein QOI68_3794, partial [Pseudonocardiales bacterium]|nr:hypothetical protein [Pseudonocardiales bacterium]